MSRKIISVLLFLYTIATHGNLVAQVSHPTPLLQAKDEVKGKLSYIGKHIDLYKILNLSEDIFVISKFYKIDSFNTNILSLIYEISIRDTIGKVEEITINNPNDSLAVSLVLDGLDCNDLNIQGKGFEKIVITNSTVGLANIGIPVYKQIGTRELFLEGSTFSSLMIGRMVNCDRWKISNCSVTENCMISNADSICGEITKTRFYGKNSKFQSSSEENRFCFSGNSFNANETYFFGSATFQSDSFNTLVSLVPLEEKRGSVFFNNCMINEDVVCRDSLPQYLGFKECKVRRSIYLDNTDLSKVCYADFDDINPSQLKYRTTNVELSLIPWQNHPDTTETDLIKKGEVADVESMLYRHLKHARNMGYEEDVRKLDLAYQKVRYDSEYRPFWDKMYYSINNFWWKFGYEKWRIGIWTAIFFLFFLCVNTWKFDYIANEVFTISNLNDAESTDSNAVGSTYKCVEKMKVFISKFKFPFFYTILIFFGLKLESSNFVYKSFCWTMYIYLMYCMGLICMGFILNYIIT